MTSTTNKLEGWPGAGPVPEPEPEGFRQQIIDDQIELDKANADDALQRSKDAKEFYSGSELSTPKSKKTTTTSKAHTSS